MYSSFKEKRLLAFFVEFLIQTDGHTFDLQRLSWI